MRLVKTFPQPNKISGGVPFFRIDPYYDVSLIDAFIKEAEGYRFSLKISMEIDDSEGRTAIFLPYFEIRAKMKL
ncbi:MAG: hypothetical protein R2860_01365 [Desulfobacterales bacterium]